MKILDRLHHLMPEVGRKSRKAHHIYKLKFNRRVRHTPRFSVDDLVYASNPPAPKYRQRLTFAGEDPSVKLRLKKVGPYRVAQATPHTVTINIDGLHKVVAVDQVTLSQAAQNVNKGEKLRQLILIGAWHHALKVAYRRVSYEKKGRHSAEK